MIAADRYLVAIDNAIDHRQDEADHRDLIVVGQLAGHLVTIERPTPQVDPELLRLEALHDEAALALWETDTPTPEQVAREQAAADAIDDYLHLGGAA